MRKMFFCLTATVILIGFQACKGSDDEPKYVTVDFEDVTLSADSTLKSSSFNSNIMTCDNVFTDWGGGMTSWSGFACSSKHDKITAGYTNDLSVYSNGAFSGSKFGVFYYSSYDVTSYCKFQGGSEYDITSVMLNNSTYAYLSIKNGNGSARQFTTNDWFKVTISGYTASGVKTDSVDYYLADFRNGSSYITENWTKVDLTKLGKVNKLTFRFSSTDNDPIYGMNTPAYVCLDDLIYKIYPEPEE